MTYSSRAQIPRSRGTRIPQSIRLAVFNRDGHYCVYCDYPADVIDHVIPYSYGGTDEMDNLVAACKVCNAILSGRVFDTFADKQRWIRAYYGPNLEKRWQIHTRRLCICSDCRRVFRPCIDGASNVLCSRCYLRDEESDIRPRWWR